MDALLENPAQVIEKLLEAEGNKIPRGELLAGEYLGLNDLGQPKVGLIDYPGVVTLAQVSMIPLEGIAPGREVALMLAQGSSMDFVLIGLIHRPGQLFLEKVIAATKSTLPDSSGDQQVFDLALPQVEQSTLGASIDGERILLDAKEEIVLRCGESSITLSKNGKISIRGKYILNRATGVNRILGGSVQVN